MTLSLEIMASVLPSDLPPWRPSTESEWRKAEALQVRDGGQGIFTRGYFWQKHLIELLRENRSWMSDSLTALAYPHELLEQAVGYIEVDAAIDSDPMIREASKGTGFFFGAVVYDHRGKVDPAYDLPQSVDIGQINVASAGLPAVRLAAADIAHAPDPVGATAACWAAKRGTVSAIQEILTVKHAFSGLTQGQRVAMASGGFAILEDFCEGSVDAALVEVANTARSHSPLMMDPDPAIGMDVEFTGATSSRRTGKITKTWVFPFDSDPYDPQRVHFDVTGAAGDSGALVRLSATGEAVGIYAGIKAGFSSQSGMSQAIWQATELLNIELYE